LSLDQHSHYAYASFEQADLVKEHVEHKLFVFPDGGKAATGKELSDDIAFQMICYRFKFRFTISRQGFEY
jgi:hypothetical protein